MSQQLLRLTSNLLSFVNVVECNIISFHFSSYVSNDSFGAQIGCSIAGQSDVGIDPLKSLVRHYAATQTNVFMYKYILVNKL